LAGWRNWLARKGKLASPSREPKATISQKESPGKELRAPTTINFESSMQSNRRLNASLGISVRGNLAQTGWRKRKAK
jgi:hypothetical protein